MKRRKLFTLAILLGTASAICAQTTYSRYDVNHDGKEDIEDVTILTNRLLGKTNFPVTSIVLSQSAATVLVGNTVTLVPTVLPTDADNPTVTWRTSDASVAEVTDGIVTAIAAGTATITATANDGSGVSAECTVTVSDDPSDSHEYVDLGLTSGTLWATCNVGASKPEEYGLYFAWGETTGYTSAIADGHSFDWTSYKWCNGSYTTMTKYCYSSKYGAVDNKTELESADDAATVNWDSKWKMPTQTQWAELKSQCTWLMATLNGVSGYKVTGTNGNCIFLPAAGSRTASYLNNGGGSLGCYWSGSLNTQSCYRAYLMAFDSNSYCVNYTERYSGESVRAVRSE